MTPQSDRTTAEKHEARDVDVIGVALVVMLVLLLGCLSFLSAWGLLRLVQKGKDSRAIEKQAIARLAIFPRPQLQVNPGAELKATQVRSEARLQNYGWIDEKAGVAHIPIERAMQLTLARGLPEVGGGQTRLQLMQARPAENVQPNEQRTQVSPPP